MHFLMILFLFFSFPKNKQDSFRFLQIKINALIIWEERENKKGGIDSNTKRDTGADLKTKIVRLN